MKKHIIKLDGYSCSVRKTKIGLYLRTTRSANNRRKYYWHKTKQDALAAQQKWAQRKIKEGLE